MVVKLITDEEWEERTQDLLAEMEFWLRHERQGVYAGNIISSLFTILRQGPGKPEWIRFDEERYGERRKAYWERMDQLLKDSHKGKPDGHTN